MKNNKKTLAITLSIFAFLLIGVIFYFAVFNSVTGVSQNLEYSCISGCIDEENFEVDDLESGSAVTEAYLSNSLPNDTNLILFTVNLGSEIHTDYKSSSDVSFSAKYEIYNYLSDSWETILNENFNLDNYNTETVSLRFDGESVYLTGIPEKLTKVCTSYSDSSTNRKYTWYVSCLEGMTNEEAKTLHCATNPAYSVCTDSRYTLQCVYPGESVNEHGDDDDGDENYDIYYFPELISIDTNYIEDNNILLRISTSINGAHDSITEKDFDIELWDVKTNVIDTYSFDGTQCNYQAKYTYQTTSTDYFTKDECEYDNGLIECYLDEQCNASEGYIADCNSGVCEEEADTWWNNIFPDKDEPEDSETTNEENQKPNLLNYFLIGGIVIFLIILILLIRKRK